MQAYEDSYEGETEGSKRGAKSTPRLDSSLRLRSFFRRHILRSSFCSLFAVDVVDVYSLVDVYIAMSCKLRVLRPMIVDVVEGIFL